MGAKQRHLGCFGFDDHTKAIAEYKRHESMAAAELEALFNIQYTIGNRQHPIGVAIANIQ
jgi:hypothetical protein